MNILRKIYLLPVRFYKEYISDAVCPECIYTPSCSLYFIEAVERFGIIKGTIIGILRIFRCNRLFLGGPDPVPEKFCFKELLNTFKVFKRHK